MIVRFDPALIRALDFAIGEKLVEFQRLASGGLNVALTDLGTKAAAALGSIQDCMVAESHFLDELRGSVSQTMIDRILRWGQE